MTCQHLETLRELRTKINALDLDGENGCYPDPLLPPKPFFGGRWAPWAVKSHLIDDHPENEILSREFWRMASGEINLNSHEWAITVHFFDRHTPRTQALDIKHPSWCNMTSADRLPWDASWQHADDGDSFVTLIDRDTGQCYLIWQTRYDRSRNIMLCGTANIVRAGYKPHGTDDANIWTKANGYEPSRAAGIALPHMLVTSSEVREGLIPHCLALALPQPSRGRRFAPATKNIGFTGSPGTGRLGTGVRLAFDQLEEREVQEWADGFDSGIRDYMHAIGTAVRDYGFLLVDNGGRGKRGSVYLEHNISARWDEIGLTKQVLQQAIYGLVKPNIEKVRILAEPEFPGGDMNEMARYAGVEYPADLARG